MANSKYVTDHDLMGEKLEVTHSEVMHFGKLTEEELVIEKKLRRKIDSLIMPLVILVYLMNYIDRSVQSSPPRDITIQRSWLTSSSGTTMQLRVCKAWRRIFTYTATSIKLLSRSYSSAMSSCRFHPICSSIILAALLSISAFSSSRGVLCLL
jgi:hypothetical protein